MPKFKIKVASQNVTVKPFRFTARNDDKKLREIHVEYRKFWA